MTTTEPSVATLDDALQAVRAMRLEVAELRAELTTEVRTRRLVVLDEQGREAIYTTIKKSYASLTVEFPYADREYRTCDVMLSAGGPGHSMGVVGEAGVYLAAGSECAGHLQVQRSFADLDRPHKVVAESTLELFELVDDESTESAPQLRRQMSVEPTRILAATDSYRDVIGVAQFVMPTVTS